jgi:hypothetical protein
MKAVGSLAEARIMLCTQWPISPSRGPAGWVGSALGCVFDSRLRRSRLLPPSSVAKTPSAEMPTQILSASAGSNRIVCRTNPAPPGFQLPDGG